MTENSIRIFPLGDSALTVEFGAEISVELNKRVVAFARHFEQNPFPGLIEAVPAYSSATIFYDVATVRRAFTEFPTAFAAVQDLAAVAIDVTETMGLETGRLVKIPVRFDNDSALDLAYVAKKCGLSPVEVIEIFIGATYRVFMLGFLPGFAYMGAVDERITTERRSSPRDSVPAGSIGIAGRQTGIYSLASPGGWQIIGRTDSELFTPENSTPCLLRPGDEVRFIELR
jgi:inhibitor of KinA